MVDRNPERAMGLLRSPANQFQAQKVWSGAEWGLSKPLGREHVLNGVHSVLEKATNHEK